VITEANKRAEIITAQQSLDWGEEWLFRKPFAREWGVSHWTKWATIAYAFDRLGVRDGAEILDVGCGIGWTTVFLAESGWRPTGMDLAPARIVSAQDRAERWGVEAEFATADMDDFDLGRQFDAILVYDALHHSARQSQVIANVARHLKPGGWVLFGEPSVLHAISPHARRTSRESGWIERGIGIRRLKRDCAASGLGSFRRFHEPTTPFARSVRGLLDQTARLVLSFAAWAPRHSVWLAAQRPPA
jgi:2-polyprenyl-3-methyl-5-hydroxy-6-metoxy-1,4-benzoquinol methylase